MQQYVVYLFYCKITLYVSGVFRTQLSGVHETVTTASGTGHNVGAATSLQRGQVLTCMNIMNVTRVGTLYPQLFRTVIQTTN
jgi:hypothetical protein